MKIGIDIDDVIVDFIPSFLEFYNLKTGKNICFEDWKKYYPWENECFGGTKTEALKIVSNFFDSEFFERMKLMDNAKEVLNKLSEENKLIILTSRDSDFKDKTESFLVKTFPDIDFDIIYSGDLYGNGNKNKSEICNDLGIFFLIDDNGDYAFQCAEKGVRVLLFDKPWNRGHKDHNNIIRVKNWNEILEKLEGRG